jgi:hypothetical protein
MSEETLYLNWLSARINSKIIEASTEEPAGSLIQWHPTGSTIYIVKKDMQEVEIRVDQEVHKVEVKCMKYSFHTIDSQ